MSRYALVATVKQYLKSPLQTCDEGELLEAINAIRQELYSWYEDTGLFVDVEECFELQDFCRDCLGTSRFRGITLPPDYAAVEAMWFADTPVPLRSRWRAWQDGFPARCDCGLTSHDLGDSFATMRDLLPGRPDYVGAQALDPDDFGKVLRIRGEYASRATFEETLTLGPDWVYTPYKVAWIDRNGGVSKDITAGRVLLAQKGDGCGGERRLLADYRPNEEVPAYKRLQIVGIPEGCPQVFIRAARNYLELFNDDDVVETGNRRAWEDMGRWIRIHRKTDRTHDDIASESAYRNAARAILMGDKARSIGKSVRQDVRLATPSLGRHSLHRGRRRF